MVAGFKVTGLSECMGFTFVKLKADDGLGVDLQFKSGDERVREFQFGACVLVEVNPIILQRAIDLVERLLKKALTREKRARTLRRVWTRRVRYYSRKLAAAKSVAIEGVKS